ncbi:MAG TPA: hypothetical protein VK656_05155 [Candidatus Acidoferrum sp.]|nr:hypothetical protein [Candidatus Acidoferrum sp.]
MAVRRFVGVVLMVTAIALGGCVTASSPAPIPLCGEGSTTAPDGTIHCTQNIFPTTLHTPHPTPDATQICGSENIAVENIAVENAPFSIPALVGYGWGFVVAEVTSPGPAFFNTADRTKPPGFGLKPTSADEHPDVRIYTPFDVQVYQVITGPTKAGSGRVLIEGGTVGCYTTTVDVAPRVTIGKTYVFVLADAYDADRSQALDTREAKVAWPVDADGVVSTPDGPMSLDALERLVRAAPKSP